MAYMKSGRKSKTLDTELGLLLSTGTLLGEQHCLDVGQDTTLSNGNPSQQLVQFFIIPYGKLKMPWDDTRLLIIPRSIACQLQDLGSQILHDSCHIHWSPSSD